MNIEKVHPEFRVPMIRMTAPPFHIRFMVPIFRFLFRFIPLGKPLEGVNITEQKLQNSTVRIYRPESELSGAGMLFLHGGGFLIGSSKMNDKECSEYAKLFNMVVVSADYRLAPEHPFPAAINDCFEAWNWVVSETDSLGVDSARLVVSGQSAGGGLAATLVHKILDQGGVQPIAQLLFAPMLDDRTGTREFLTAMGHRMWNNKSNFAAWSWYLGQPPGNPDAPEYASAARRDTLFGLPPTWIGVGDLDLFFEENKHYAERLRKDGVDCQLDTVEGAPHGFESLVPNAPKSREFFDKNHRFLKRILEN